MDGVARSWGVRGGDQYWGQSWSGVGPGSIGYDVLAARKFQEHQRCRAERKREEEQKKAEEEQKHAEEARKAAEVKKAEEAWKAAEAKKATVSVRGTLTAGGGAKCEGCESTGVDYTMEMPSGSKATTCDHCHRQKMECMCPRVEKKERQQVRSPEVEDNKEDEEEEDALQLIARAIDDLMQELKEMQWEYREQGKWVAAAINNLQHMLDLEYVAGPEEESDLEVPEEEVAEASAELGEFRKEVEQAAEEPEDEGSEEEEGSDDDEV
ncbi:hypothetical protein HYDPIDRAFT_33478 [Hydnomerulius pinastri MD-312]|uniref:Unplaced genomic scaffold scaffold_62, whole genome shotgun sequence n=1 Tax=Hydnomerulius pinastri MD-312 TaxID=994086 RepID=A0A0C9W836_9AGAM|nr:hypothetical protein HYDPIDRAFT_33478 [Hydnomerulius pinastri MD-312]